MTVVLSVLIVASCLFISAYLIRGWFFQKPPRNSKLPARGKATMFHVRHLLMEGEKELAVQLYCEIFNAPPSKAKKDVEELQRSLKV